MAKRGGQSGARYTCIPGHSQQSMSTLAAVDPGIKKKGGGGELSCNSIVSACIFDNLCCLITCCID